MKTFGKAEGLMLMSVTRELKGRRGYKWASMPPFSLRGSFTLNSWRRVADGLLGENAQKKGGEGGGL